MDSGWFPRTLAIASVVILGFAAVLAFPFRAGAAIPPVPVPSVVLPASVDPPSGYDGQIHCHPVDSRGVLALRRLLLATYGDAVIGGSRSCGGSVSEHYDGRALDWMRSVRVPYQAAQVEAFLAWLLAPAPDGTPHEMARRLGIMYLIWNNRMIRMYEPARGWTQYKGCLAGSRSAAGMDTTCHRNHLHISLGWAGAEARTSWWTGSVSATSGGTPPALSAPATITPISSQFGSGSGIPARAPGRPRSVVAKLRRGVIVVAWRPPSRAGRDQVAAYLVTARASSPAGTVAGTCLATRSARSCRLPNLPRGIRYWVAVSATNLAGPSGAALRPVLLP